MRTIHADKSPQSVRQLIGIGNILQRCNGSQFPDLGGQYPSGSMLGQKRVDQVHQLAGLAKAGKEEILFQLFVIVLHEMTNDIGGTRQNSTVESLLGGEEMKVIVVNEQNADQHAVLTH